MFNFVYVTNEGIKEHNPKWPEIPEHTLWIVIIGSSPSGKADAFLNLINHEPDKLFIC